MASVQQAAGAIAVVEILPEGCMECFLGLTRVMIRP